MKKQRADHQTVDAFSAPRDLLRAAQEEAKRRRMTKSGFYRYCLAKELGMTGDEAEQLAAHASIGNFSVVQSNSPHATQNVFSSSSAAPARKVAEGRKGKRGRKGEQ